MSVRPVVFCAGREPASVPAGAFVHHLNTDDPYDYARALAWHWTEPYDLITIEHDMIVPDDAVWELIHAGGVGFGARPAAIPYTSYPIKTGLRDPIWSAWNPGTARHFVDEGESDASHSALGCTYFPLGHLSRRYPLPYADAWPHWTSCDAWISRHVNRFSADPRPFRLVWSTGVEHEVPTKAHPM